MNFHKFIFPVGEKKIVESITMLTSPFKGLEEEGDIVSTEKLDTMALLCMSIYIMQRKPFFRVYPGVLEPLLKMKLGSEKGFKVPTPEGLDMTSFSIELPTDGEYAVTDGKDTLASIIMSVVDCGYVIIAQTTDNKIYQPVFFDTDSDDPRKAFEDVQELLRTALDLCIGVLAIGNNPDLVRRIVLKRDEKKYAEFPDSKYEDRAIRNGVNGFSIGEDVPTVKELQSMVREGNKIAPHLRMAHLARYWTGKGRTVPKIILVKTIFVNAAEVCKLPQGYYSKGEAIYGDE